MSSEGKPDGQLEIAHVLFIDIVGYSKLPINRQSELLQQLNQIVRATEQFRRAEAADKLVRLPTGDGMALAFFTSPDAPVRCALEISEAVGQALPPVRQSDGLVQGRAGEKRGQAGALALQLRMGINSGPVDAVADVNDRSNVAGAGINLAQRVMDCGDAGHILLAKRVADDLGQYEEWQPYLHELGAIEVKHGVRVEVVNFYDEQVGNPELPEKVKRFREEQSAREHRASSIAARKRSLIIGSLLMVVVGIAASWLLFHRIAPRSTSAVSTSIPDKSIAVLPLDNLRQEKARVEAKPTNNTAAYDAYLRGRAFASGDPFDKPTVDGAIHSYQEAVKLDPNFVLAWARLSSVQSNSYWTGLDPSPVRLAAAKDSLDRALALDPNLPETHLALGYYRYYGQRDFAGALAEFQLAEKNLPNNVDVLAAMGLIQRRLGHWDEAIAALRRVVELDPRNINSASNLAITYMAVRHFSDALVIADHILTVEPTNASGIGIKTFNLLAMGDLEAAEAMVANPHTDVEARGYYAMIKRRYAEVVDILVKGLNDKSDREKAGLFLDIGLAQQRAGNVAAARAAYQQAAQEFQRELGKAAPDAGPAAELHSNLGVAYAGLGDAASAVAEGQKGMVMQPSSEDPFEGPSREEAMAQIYALLGDADHAIPILKRLVQTSAPTEIVPALLRLDPIWDSIRNDPRFQELVTEKKP